MSSSSSSQKQDSIKKKHSIRQTLNRQLKNHSFKKVINKFASCFLFHNNRHNKGVVIVNDDCCSHNIPLDIQTDIMKMLPVKSLVRFRCVSKQWKSIIDSSEFIKSCQGMNHHLLVRYNVNDFISIFDNDDTFPEHKSPITVPSFINLCDGVEFRPSRILGSSHGLICVYGFLWDNAIQIVFVLWNPSISKSVTVNIEYSHDMWIGFGVCCETLDPKIVIFDILEVYVYTLSSKVWKKLSVKSPWESRDTIRPRKSEGVFDTIRPRKSVGVSVKGFIYWIMRDFILSFDVTNENFGQVYLPDILLRAPLLKLSKRNESLTVIAFDFRDQIFGVWMMDDGFTKYFTIPDIRLSFVFFRDVLEFRKNGEAIILATIDVNHSMLQVYDPCFGRISGDLGIDMGTDTLLYGISVCSYMETLLLLDE